MKPFRTSPSQVTGMPTGIPHIIGNEAAERFSFYGMKAILVTFMASYLHLMDDTVGIPMSAAAAKEQYHLFNVAVYLIPLLGAFLADTIWGKYRTIVWLSIVYCFGHAALAFMGTMGAASWWLFSGLFLIALGSGGIKPCVSAHVGDQFGKQNSHLLPAVYYWFYFSINVGAMISMALTPWLLEWHGPHWAFGVPGVLMAIATLVFWMGRHRFVHIPPAGKSLFSDLKSKAGRSVLWRLAPLYLFAASFWMLFDQTGSSWILQAEDMDMTLFGVPVLPAQLQSLNSFLVLVFIPLFGFVLYPAINRLVPFGPLRKIGVGLFLGAASFALLTLVQTWIDSGQRPNMIWQVIAYVLLTAGEVMVSVTCLEFAYTQAPKSMKSLVMCFYLGSVALGNYFAMQVNSTIQTGSPLREASAMREIADAGFPTKAHPGYDGKIGTNDDIREVEKQAGQPQIEFAAAAVLQEAAAIIEAATVENSNSLPSTEEGAKRIKGMKDPWGNDLIYQQLTSMQARILAPGPDKKAITKWDQILMLRIPESLLQPEDQNAKEKPKKKTWLERRKEKLNYRENVPDESHLLSRTLVAGDQVTLQGSAYFQFFAWIALFAAILYVPIAIRYRGETILHE